MLELFADIAVKTLLAPLFSVYTYSAATFSSYIWEHGYSRTAYAVL